MRQLMLLYKIWAYQCPSVLLLWRNHYLFTSNTALHGLNSLGFKIPCLNFTKKFRSLNAEMVCQHIVFKRDFFLASNVIERYYWYLFIKYIRDKSITVNSNKYVKMLIKEKNNFLIYYLKYILELKVTKWKVGFQVTKLLQKIKSNRMRKKLTFKKHTILKNNIQKLIFNKIMIYTEHNHQFIQSIV